MTTKKSLQAPVSFRQFGAKKCSERLVPTNTLFPVMLPYRKRRTVKNATGRTQTQAALLLGHCLQTTSPKKAPIARLKNHSLASAPDTERAWPICDQMEDSIIAVPKTATIRFSRNTPTG